MRFRKILIAIDGTAIAAHAAQVGTELARALASEVAFVHAVDPALASAPETGVSPAALLAEFERDGRKLLAEFRQRAAAQPAAAQPAPLEFLPVGTPGAEIVKVARDWPADLIVMGSHGRGGLARLLVGSVAETVMRHAPCPVLVVRAQA